MPPKGTTAPTRKSTRTASTKPASAAKPAPAKSSKKRAHVSDDEEDVSDDDKPKKKKPASKKKKSAAVVEEDDEEEVEDEPKKKPASKKVDADEDKPAKMVKVVKRNKSVPVDHMSGKVATHEVYSDGVEDFDAMLNQTDISGSNNKNKYYILQLLHPIGNPASSLLYTRWGRVGENGSTQVKGPFSANEAVVQFKKQFQTKAGVKWEARVGMEAKKGKYLWLERDLGDDDEEEDKAEGNSGTQEETKPKAVPPSALPPPVQNFCKLIFSTSIIDATLKEMNYDANKLPLGKMSKSTILKGFSALKELAEVIEKTDGDLAKSLGGFNQACEDLSSKYYSIIPHDFGRSRPVVIRDKARLQKELDLVDALGDMEVASKLISSTVNEDEDGNPINQLDSQFNSLGLTGMEPLDKDSTEYGVLESYCRDTHGKTHNIRVQVEHIFRVERDSERKASEKGGFKDVADGERLLLWHGSRTTNFAGILSQGLRIAPPEAPVSGYMFGKGIYFADMMSKSANYCFASMSNNMGVLLLCEVAAKPFHELTDADYHADQGCKAAGKRATLGLGKTAPTKWKDAGKALGNDDLLGCQMPDGAVKDIDNGGWLQYNEYIVYDVSQVRIKYLLMVKM
ncbi:poly polymerase catalytic domain-containing protein [Mycena floridula]|nr:poly polymerase catalytic domain-containing protein [Mycena floridula]